MKKTIAVFGATGNQGGSVARFILNDHELSQQYNLRIVVRNATKPAVQEFKSNGAEIVEATLDDESTLRKALRGTNRVFLLTNFFDHLSMSKEIEQGKRAADAAVAEGVDFLVYSSLPSATEISNNTITGVQHFDGKAETEKYIRSLPIKSAFFRPGAYMQNFLHSLRPRPVGDGSFAISNVVNPNTRVPLLDIRDTGKYVGEMLINPNAFVGKDIDASASCYTFTEVAEILSRLTGGKIIYQQIPDAMFKGFLPESTREEIGDMMILFREFGLNGPGQEGKVAADAQLARQKPTSLAKFLEEHVDEFADLRPSTV